MKLKQRLRGVPDRLATEPLLADLEQRVNELRETTSEQAREAEAIIQAGATLNELQQLTLDWQSLSKQIAGLAEIVTRQAAAVEAEIRSLREEQTRWDQAHDQIKAEESSQELVDLTANAQDEIRAAKKVADDQRARIIALQQAIAALGSIATGEVDNVRKAMAESQRSLFEPDSPPLWRIQFSSQRDEALQRLLSRSSPLGITRLTHLVGAKRRALFGIVILTLVALAVFVALNRRTKTVSEPTITPSDPREVFRRPASLALLVGLVATMPLLVEAPTSAKGILDLLFVVPVFRLLVPRVGPHFRRLLFVLVPAMLTWEVIGLLHLPIWIKRDLLAVFLAAVIAFLLWLARATHREEHPHWQRPSIAVIAFYVVLPLIVISFFANLFGYFGLSDLITNGTLVSSYRAVAGFTVFVIGKSMISFVLQTETARRLVSVRTGAGRIERRLSFALALMAFLAWLHTSLNLFAVRDDIYRAGIALLNYQITIGNASFAPANLVVFLLTLFFGYLIAAITRTILGDEILPRLNLARGLPNAIATITHYVLLLMVFLLALAASGVELSRFTILTGAFGVGAGFGLQNVISNFISGLILLFERPVRVGDSLEIGQLNGEVTKIGFRSSTLHSGDGADLIIPNAMLISQQVVNWSLSGTRRRVFFRVRVAYGNDPQYVRDLLLATATGHPDVLKVPKPTALFLGFGESALEFEVRFWAPRSDIVPELTSDVALRIAAALRDAGIKVPFPQRDLHLKSIDESAREMLPTSGKDEG
ncbi:MAG TPA: mechanosensitive ion channel domain-containing protein [Blastocatellia bacterium]|nr:mechanosensitive ion channel domain-containing protein [Blastocatellia bacterium]